MTDTPEQRGNRDLDALLRWLVEAHALAEPLTELPVRLDRGRDRARLETFVVGAVVVGRQLALGTVAEVEARRPANAMRLARHLWEQDFDLHYVLGNPVPRIRQMFAREAKHQFDLERYNPGISLNPDDEEQVGAAVREANLTNAEMQRREKAGEAVPASAWGTPPNRAVMARALDRVEDYRLFYAGASWLSHPGIVGTVAHFEVRGDRAWVRSEGRDDPLVAEEAVVLALKSLVGLIDRANWSVGPLPGLAATLDDLTHRAEGSV